MLYQCNECQASFDTLKTNLASGICPACGKKFKGDFAGTVVRDFIVIGELARGANGVVYVAQQPLLCRDVAMKLILKEHENDPEHLEQFFSEARAAARVAHPNIVQALAAGVDENKVCYFAMELVEGETLEKQLDDFGALEFSQALHIAVRLAEALAYAWRRVKLVHGDIKPANVLMTPEGEPKLADLGQAHFGDDITEVDSLMATPLYVPPELVRGEYEKIGAKTDIYSFGAMLYELFAGEPPLYSLDMDEILQMQLTEKPQSLKSRLGFFDEKLSDFIDRMLAKNPDLRPDSWNEVAEFLKKIELRVKNQRK
ncbi:MAG: serine/threonine protein kinase [Lentisphaeria bacterium]|nr:serine/threonine protein kinase [Lentisphaeria bacterium]